MQWISNFLVANNFDFICLQRFYETNRLAQDGIAINAWQAGNKRRNVQDGGSVSNSVKRLGL